MLFNISDRPFFEDNPEARAIPSFVKVGETAMKYICLVYGYNTPFRSLPIDTRKEKVVSICDIEKTPKGRMSKLEKSLRAMSNKDLVKAVEDFNQMQFDIDRDTHDAYMSHLNQCKELLRKSNKNPKEIDQALKISKDYNSLVSNEKELRSILEMRNAEEFKVDNVSEEDDLQEDSEMEQFMEGLKD